jgi:hypothetical protein
MKLALALLLAGCALATAQTEVAMWDSCGGMSSHGLNATNDSIKCPAGSYCNFYNEWFWQCQPDGTSFSQRTDTYTYPVDCDNRIPLYGSCGGISSDAKADEPDADVCCPIGTACRYYNEYFWQCQPVAYNAPPEAPDRWSTGCNGEKAVTWGACGGTD